MIFNGETFRNIF
jgi:hypothetical protein